jgi:hypothetical protein
LCWSLTHAVPGVERDCYHFSKYLKEVIMVKGLIGWRRSVLNRIFSNKREKVTIVEMLNEIATDMYHIVKNSALKVYDLG